MRVEEILSLRWKYVDLNRAVLTIMKTKNGERRTIPLNRIIIALLQRRSKVISLVSDYVFITSVGTKIDQGNMRADFIKARKKAGLDDFRFHDLRHTFATRLVQSGVDLYKVQRLLGHKSPAMTQRYAHHYPESLRGAVDILAESFQSRGTIGAQSAPIENKGATSKLVTP